MGRQHHQRPGTRRSGHSDPQRAASGSSDRPAFGEPYPETDYRRMAEAAFAAGTSRSRYARTVSWSASAGASPIGGRCSGRAYRRGTRRRDRLRTAGRNQRSLARHRSCRAASTAPSRGRCPERTHQSQLRRRTPRRCAVPRDDLSDFWLYNPAEAIVSASADCSASASARAGRAGNVSLAVASSPPPYRP